LTAGDSLDDRLHSVNVVQEKTGQRADVGQPGPQGLPRSKAMGILDNAPGPSPWYLRSGSPAVPGFEWRGISQSSRAAGAIVLAGRKGTVLILDFHNYVVLLDPDTLLIWHQHGLIDSGPTPPVMLRVFRLSELRPLQGDLETLCASMRHAGAPLASSGSPLFEFPIPTTVASRRFQLVFPEELRRLSELLILCHSSGVEESPPPDRSNLAILVARPREGTYQLYPQDWFNSAKLDYGYQSVTRVARDPRTGRIHGEGFRIEPFVLDKTLRHARWKWPGIL
jgi:hypothetical protein